MKVKELIKVLKTQNPNAIVVVSKDSEGNSFGTVHPDSINTYEDYPDIIILFPHHEGLEMDEIIEKEKGETR